MPPRGKPLGYYRSGVASLKKHLEHSANHPKLVQVQSHLITKHLEARPEFKNPRSTPLQAQLEAYVDVVRSVRADLEKKLILRLLPGTGQ